MALSSTTPMRLGDLNELRYLHLDRILLGSAIPGMHSALPEPSGLTL